MKGCDVVRQGEPLLAKVWLRRPDRRAKTEGVYVNTSEKKKEFHSKFALNGNIRGI